MKNISRLLILLPLLFFTPSCETDFEVTADYKEITIVYGLLSQNDTTHYLRINKAFLGSGNALVYASQKDSSSYGADILVTLTETSSTGVKRDILFDTVTIHDKDTGVFYSPDQLMYKADALLDAESTYQLTIKNKKTGTEITSFTNLVKDFLITKPPKDRSIDFKRAITSSQKFEWTSAINGKRYQPILKFYFKESSQPNDTIIRVIDWVFPVQKSLTFKGGEKMSVEYKNEDFFVLCQNLIPYDDQSKEDAVNIRIAEQFDLTFTAVGDEFSTYLDVNGPSTGLLLEKPSYTNIQNGIGVFSCRFLKHQIEKIGENTKKDLQAMGTLHFFAN